MSDVTSTFTTSLAWEDMMNVLSFLANSCTLLSRKFVAFIIGAFLCGLYTVSKILHQLRHTIAVFGCEIT